MNVWFSNRGQIIQLLVQTAAAIMAAVVAIQQNYISVFWALIALPVFVLVVWWLIRASQSVPPADTTTGTSVPTNSTGSPQETLRISPSESQSGSNGKRTMSWSIERITLREGSRWNRDTGLVDRYEIRLTSIVTQDGAGEPEARIEVRSGIGQYLAGKEIRHDKNANNIFFVPESRTPDINRTVLAGVVSGGLLRLFSVRVDHIDIHSKTVELEIGFVQGFDSSVL